MRPRNLARHLILNGVVLTLLLTVAFYPIVAMVIVWETATARLHPIATLARLLYICVMLVVALVAWKKDGLRLAMVFFAMVGVAAYVVAFIHWRW